MPDREERQAEQEIDAAAALRQHRRELVAGVVVALGAVLLGAAAIWHFRPAAVPVARAAAETGTVDMRQVLEAHPDYERWQALRGKVLALRLALEETPEIVPLPALVQPPQVSEQPFKDSVWQKNAQAVISERVRLERERKQAAAAYKEETRAAYEAQRKAIDDEYLNAILNLNLKLDNQAQMHHPWSKKEDMAAERAGWEAELAALKKERGRRQRELWHAWQQQIADHVEEMLAPKIATWRQQARTSRDQQQSAALASQAEAQARDTGLLEAQMQLSKQVQQHLAQREQLAQAEQELEALEAHIYNDVAGKAAKIAILHHFTLILVQPTEPPAESGLMPAEAKGFGWTGSYQPWLVNVQAEDVTEELAAEVRTLAPAAPTEQENK